MTQDDGGAIYLIGVGFAYDTKALSYAISAGIPGMVSKIFEIYYKRFKNPSSTAEDLKPIK